MKEEMVSAVPSNATGSAIAGTGSSTDKTANLPTWVKKKTQLPLRQIVRRKDPSKNV